MLTHIDLFSGIGGFALAAQWAGFRTEAFCEKDKFCQEALKARFGAVANTKGKQIARKGQKGLQPQSTQRPILIPDIRDFDGTQWQGATLLTGGFPCQPFSCAGKHRGKDDDRWLWPEMLRVISEARPAWVIGENVAGIISMELEQVCADLEGEGYEVQPLVIPACAVNAPHRRDRVWVIANSGGGAGTRGTSKPGRKAKKRNVVGWPDSHAPDAKFKQCNGAGKSRREGAGFKNPNWGTPWPEVAARLCRVDDGVPRRVDRLKALGNAIVPQVACEIMKAIKITEEASP